MNHILNPNQIFPKPQYKKKKKKKKEIISTNIFLCAISLYKSIAYDVHYPHPHTYTHTKFPIARLHYEDDSKSQWQSLKVERTLQGFVYMRQYRIVSRRKRSSVLGGWIEWRKEEWGRILREVKRERRTDRFEGWMGTRGKRLRSKSDWYRGGERQKLLEDASIHFYRLFLLLFIFLASISSLYLYHYHSLSHLSRDKAMDWIATSFRLSSI